LSRMATAPDRVYANRGFRYLIIVPRLRINSGRIGELATLIGIKSLSSAK
jgi:hypothetical protein